jgi:hypothetical protein
MKDLYAGLKKTGLPGYAMPRLIRVTKEYVGPISLFPLAFSPALLSLSSASLRSQTPTLQNEQKLTTAN